MHSSHLLRTTLVSVLLLTSAGASVQAGESVTIKPRLANQPPMGWNTWNAFRKHLDEHSLREEVDAIVNLGFRDAGYKYFIIDGGWKTTQRDAKGNLVIDPNKFPSGMKAFADYVHAHGLKFGLHEPAGIKDCGQDEPGSQGNEERDAKLFTSWGIDFLKYDQCTYVHDPHRTFGSPDIDKIVIRSVDGKQQGPIVFTSEAEAPQNHLTGLVRVENRQRCSGGKCVAGIGLADGALEIPDLSVGTSGIYQLEVIYCYPYFGQNRDHFAKMEIFVHVNGDQRQDIKIPYAIKDRYTTGSFNVTVQLNKGKNKIVLDNPWSEEEDVRLSYIKMTNSLFASGREIMFSTSGASRPWLWARPVAHLWRTDGDLSPRWTAMMSTIDRQEETLEWSGPGFWADPDMLQVGSPKLNEAESQAHFSLWAISNAPLFISTDLRHASAQTLKILLNRQVIAVDQDPLGVPGRRIRNDGQTQIFAKPLADGGEAVAILNRGTQAATITVNAKEFGLKPLALHAQNLWSGESQNILDGKIESRIQPHAVVMLRITPSDSTPPASQP